MPRLSTRVTRLWISGEFSADPRTRKSLGLASEGVLGIPEIEKNPSKETDGRDNAPLDPWTCPVCHGTRFLSYHNGNRFVEYRCEACGGTGQIAR